MLCAVITAFLIVPAALSVSIDASAYPGRLPECSLSCSRRAASACLHVCCSRPCSGTGQLYDEPFGFRRASNSLPKLIRGHVSNRISCLAVLLFGLCSMSPHRVLLRVLSRTASSYIRTFARLMEPPTDNGGGWAGDVLIFMVRLRRTCPSSRDLVLN